MRMRAAWIAMAAIALSACATTRSHAPAMASVDQPQAYQAQRESRLSAFDDWAMSGRIAVSNGKDGGSGRIEWKQAGPRFEVALAAPVTRQSWRVTGGEGDAVLEGLDGGPRTGANAHDLILAATHWDIPVDALAGWMRGVPGPGAQVRYGADGRLAGLEQDGWSVAYTAWAPTPADPTLAMPARLEATKGQARVRLAVDDWTLEPGP